MKKIMIILLISQMANSCFLMPLGAPQGHKTKNITNPNSQIKMIISCLPYDKYYIVSGTEVNDNIYISSGKMEKQENLLTDKTFVNHNNEKAYRLRIGDAKFQRKILKDTINVRIVKSDSTIEIYKFLVIKDDYIKN